MGDINKFDFPNLRKGFSKTVHGTISYTLSFLVDTINETLTPNEIKTKNIILERFQKRIFPSNLKEPPFIQDLLQIYYNYWLDGLLETKDRNVLEEELLNNLKNLIKNSNFNDNPDLNEIKIIDDFEKLESIIKSMCEKLNYFILTGVTKPYRELIIWKDEIEEKFEIDLGDCQVMVPVIFLSNFLCTGWLGFATNNIFHVGGWTTHEYIYQTESKPKDINDEKFSIDILVHEGRHFSDYVLYPKIKQGELEYRAKLSELIKSKNTIYLRLNNFLQIAKDDPKIPHSYASYKIMRHLSKEIFNITYNEKIDEWKNISINKLNKSAESILNRCSHWLNENNPNEIEEFLENRYFE